MSQQVPKILDDAGHFLATLRAFPDLYFQFSRDGIIEAYRSGDADTFVPPEAFLGKRIVDVMPPNVSELSLAGIEAALRTGKIQSFEYPLMMDSETQWFEARLAPVGEIVLAIVRNTTDRRSAEAERHAMFARMLEAQRLESLGVLAGGIAHDFNNLLATILGCAELAEGEQDGALRAQHVVMIQDAALRATQLTRQLLAYSGKGPSDVRRVDLSTEVKEITNLLRAAVPRSVKLELKGTPNLPPVDVDVAGLRRLCSTWWSTPPRRHRPAPSRSPPA